MKGSKKMIEYVKRQNQTKKTFDADKKVPRFEFKVSFFKEPINSSPYYICVVCNRNMYKKSVVLFQRDKYSVLSDVSLV